MNKIIKVGSVVNGSVTGIEKYGIFISLDNNYTGLIHISEISESFVRNINDYVNVGEIIKVKIIDVDLENKHVKLSIKDIDYRISHKKRRKINETPTGFNSLKIKLEEWINEKNNKIIEKN